MATATIWHRKSGSDAGRVFGRELHIVHIGARQANRGVGLFQRLRPRDLQLVLQVNVRAGEEYVDARAVRPFQRSRGRLDIFAAGAGKGGDARAAHLAADAADGGKVAGRRDREAGLDDIDAQGFERMGHAQLFRGGHAAARGLFAVAQRGIEEENAILAVIRLWKLGSSRRHLPHPAYFIFQDSAAIDQIYNSSKNHNKYLY